MLPPMAPLLPCRCPCDSLDYRPPGPQEDHGPVLRHLLPLQPLAVYLCWKVGLELRSLASRLTSQLVVRSLCLQTVDYTPWGT